ncbi:MAG: hypothetical protein R3Y24_00655 [Eubacteriales bacterium]
MKQVNKLSYDLFDDTTTFVSLGKLSPEMIAFISSKVPNLKDILSTKRDIIF